MPPKIRACLGRRMGLLRPKREVVHPRFLLYAYLSPDFQETIKQRAVHGATVERIPLAEFSNWPIRIALDASEQKSIVATLGAFDDKIAANEFIVSTCRTIGDLLLARGCDSEFQISSLEAQQQKGLIDFGDGYRTKRDEHGQPGLPILRAADVAHGMITTPTQDYVSDRFRPAMGSKTSRPGDVVLTTKGTVGRVAIVPKASPEFVYSPQLCYFRAVPNGPLSPSYLFYWFRSRQFLSQADSLKGKTDMADYINLADIGSLTIQIPNDDDLLRKLDAIEAAAMRVQAENRTLAELRDTLLPRLMSGEIWVRDAEKAVEEAL